MQKVVTIGGGTGQYQILRGLKKYECDITALVPVSDDGSSSGKLRDEYGILPPGDARQCITALIPDEKRAQKLREDLFDYRFDGGHCLGNLIIAALSKKYGGFAEGIREAGEILGIKGRVLPVTLEDVVLCAETDLGDIIEGESAIADSKEKINVNRLFYRHKKITKENFLRREDNIFAYPPATEAIKAADKIVICPGGLYGSVLPHFLVGGINEALNKSKAMKVYVCNLVTKQETYDFKAGDFVKAVEWYSGIGLDKILINSRIPSRAVLKKYLSEHAKLVEDDLGDDPRVVRGDFVEAYPSERKTILRHVPEKIARSIIAL